MIKTKITNAMENKPTIVPQEIKNFIYTIRDKQVMLDSDLAKIFQVETKVFNQAVKRNVDRFPDNFRFQLTQDEFDTINLRSQFVTSSLNYGGRRYLPFVFTEQGIAMLSAVLRSDVAIKVSIEIINAFVEMRRMVSNHASLFQRLDYIEYKQLQADQKFEELFKALDSGKLYSEKGIFYNGLTLLGKRNENVTATIYTKSISNQLQLDLQRYNSQYPAIEVEVFSNAHDRFLIIDNAELYHIGASLKDLGKKWFAFSRMDIEIGRMLQILNKQ